LETKLKDLEKRRAFLSERRKKNSVKTIALVGYTNTGKSTLMNLLTHSDVYVKNELFATLDPTARAFEIDDVEFLLIDTVGFLQDLPHNLIEAFHSTLESVLDADLALIVCDGQGEYDMQLETTLSTLSSLQFNAPYLTVINKTENLNSAKIFPYGSILISAKEGLGIDNLKREILNKFKEEFLFCRLFVPYTKLKQYSNLKAYLTERKQHYTDDGQIIEVVIPRKYAEFFTEFVI